MSGAREVVEKAVFAIEPLIAEMLDYGYTNNDVSLGRLMLGEKELQVQLVVTSNPDEFLISDEED
ncbi:MAG: hypothetical protein COB35_12670 [Gammaproteobacteria bacterium]|nr:MAG: hypothetical protein COB35_12670 [Gammaproteobacteria bacterium]